MQLSAWQNLVLEKQSSVAKFEISAHQAMKSVTCPCSCFLKHSKTSTAATRSSLFMIRVPEGWCKKGLVGCGMIGLNTPRLGKNDAVGGTDLAHA